MLLFSQWLSIIFRLVTPESYIGSTVSSVGRNIVLFDKNVAHPIGTIEDYTVL